MEHQNLVEELHANCDQVDWSRVLLSNEANINSHPHNRRILI